MSVGLNPFPPRLGSCFVEYVDKRVTFSSKLRIALLHWVLIEKRYDLGFSSDSVTRLKIFSTYFSDSLRICDITTCSDVRGSASGFELSVTGLGVNLVAKFSGLIDLKSEQKHDSDRRRRESFESIRSLDSFQSDTIIDWKELLYGYNQQAASREPSQCRSIEYML